jgi:hypothetical protein
VDGGAGVIKKVGLGEHVGFLHPELAGGHQAAGSENDAIGCCMSLKLVQMCSVESKCSQFDLWMACVLKTFTVLPVIGREPW